MANTPTKEALAAMREEATLPVRLLIALRNSGALSENAYYNLLYPSAESVDEAEQLR